MARDRRRPGLRRMWVAVMAAAAVAAAASALAGSAPAQTAGALAMRAKLSVDSVRDQGCPPGVPVSPSTECASRTGDGVARGLGRVAYAYWFFVEVGTPPCDRSSARALRYPVRLVVMSKGEIHFELHESQCASAEGSPHVRSVAQDFTITGGTGLYAGASGAGRVERAIAQTSAGGSGTETWTATLVVPGLEFDVTPPVLTGAAPKRVRAPRGATRVRVRYGVTATDTRDGRVAVSCRPRSGSRFRIGRTVVTCTATDSSANTATARFLITVTRRR
jgi:hypothetical protein